MVVADGIEVYLKPAGEDGDSAKFKEIELATRDHYQGRYKRCFVPFSDAPFQVVVKFAEDFNMFSADVMHVGIGIASKEYRKVLAGRFRQRRRYKGQLLEGSAIQEFEWYFEVQLPEKVKEFEFIPAVHVPGQQVSFSAWAGQPLKMKQVQENFTRIENEESLWVLRHRKPYEQAINPGTITVFVQRGKATWTEILDERSDAGPHPRWVKGFHEPGSFQHLRSKNGRSYRFEFRPRSNTRLAEVENRLVRQSGQPLLSDAQVAAEDRYCMAEDEDFIDARERTVALRAAIETEYQKGVQRKLLAAAKRKTPVTCNCPKEMHQRAAAQKTNVSQEDYADDEPASNGSSRKPRAGSGHDATTPGSGTDSDEEAREIEPPTGTQPAEETVARTCSRCHHIKNPPKGKKLAWRERKSRWMYVRQDAPDGEEREEVGHLPVQVIDPKPLAQDHDQATNGAVISNANQSMNVEAGESLATAGLQNKEKPESLESGAETVTDPVIENGNSDLPGSTSPKR